MEHLKDPKKLEKCSQELEKLIKTKKSPKELSDWCIKCFIETYKLLQTNSWKENIDNVNLCNFILNLSKHISCTTIKDKQNVLITICNVYKHFVKKDVFYEMCNKIFDLVFKNADIKMEEKFSKIYWIILVDKFLLIENNKKTLVNADVLKNLTDDTLELIKATDLMQFCNVYLTWIVKKYFTLFNNVIKVELGECFDVIFVELCKKTENNILKPESNSKTILDVYKNILYSITTIYQNGRKSALKSVLTFSTAIFKTKMDSHHHLLQICNSILPPLLESITGSILDDCIVKDLIAKINGAIKTYDKNALIEFCLILRKILYVTITEWTKKSTEFWKNCIPVDSLMDLILLLLNILSVSTNQNVRCEKCTFTSAIHDALYLASITHYIASPAAKCEKATPQFIRSLLNIFDLQLKFVTILQKNKCPNWNVLWSAAQKNFHSDAILFYSLGKHKYSNDLFQSYYSKCLKVLSLDRNAFDLNDFSRGLYNMSICQKDLHDYRESLNNCYLSLAINNALDANHKDNSKYVKCAIQIKASAIEVKIMNKSESENAEKIQMNNVWIACIEKSTESDVLFDIMNKIDFGKLLICELEIYYDIWFATLPIVGICTSLMEIHNSIVNSKRTLGTHSKYDLVIYSGMAATLIGMQTAKYQNENISKFIKFALDSLEPANLPKNMSAEHNFIAKLLYGNTSKAHHECILYEKVKNEPPPNLSLTASVIQRAPHHVIVHPDDLCDIVPTQHSLNLTVEAEILSPLMKSIETWKSAISSINPELLNEISKYEFYINKTVEIMDIAVQILSLRGLDSQSIDAADVAYSFAHIINNRSFILRTISFIVEHVSHKNSKLIALIENGNKIVKEMLESDENECDESDTMDYVFEYLLNLVTYYFNCNEKETSLTIMTYVHNRILNEYFRGPIVKNVKNIKISFAKLITVQSLFIDNKNEECISLLTNMVNGYVECADLIKSEGRNGQKFIALLRLWTESGLQAGKLALMLGLPRRARALLKGVLQSVQRLFLPRTTAEILLLLAHIDLACERFDDCKVKIDAIDYILEEQNLATTKETNVKSTVPAVKNAVNKKVTSHSSAKQRKELEMVLDVPMDKYSNDNLGSSPIFNFTPYNMPSFIDHENSCTCEKCTNIRFFNLVLGIAHIKAQIYFKTGELNITNSYFDGSLKLVEYLKTRSRYINDANFKRLKYISCDNIDEHKYYKMFINTEAQLNVDASYFYITENDNEKAQSLNKHAMSLTALLSPNNVVNLLMQLIYEQNLYFIQSEIFKKQVIADDLLELNKDFSAKLQLTPEKIVQNVEMFKTPCNKKSVKPPNPIQRPKRNVVKVLSHDIENEPEFVRPTIKLDLDAEDVIVPEPKKDDILISSENIDKTPAPRIRTTKNVMSESRATRSKTSVVPSSLKTPKITTLKRSTSPGSLNQLENNKNITDSALKRTTRIKREVKLNLSPDVDLVNKYSIRRKL